MNTYVSRNAIRCSKGDATWIDVNTLALAMVDDAKWVTAALIARAMVEGKQRM
jgi:hypothetical protein